MELEFLYNLDHHKAHLTNIMENLKTLCIFRKDIIELQILQ